jgi:hypothetical protein
MMLKYAAAIVLLSSPALAQTGSVDCQPIGKTASGEMVYGMDCKMKPENRTENQPNMPQTTLHDTVIPKAGATQTPETTPTTGVNK